MNLTQTRHVTLAGLAVAALLAGGCAVHPYQADPTPTPTAVASVDAARSGTAGTKTTPTPTATSTEQSLEEWAAEAAKGVDWSDETDWVGPDGSPADPAMQAAVISYLTVKSNMDATYHSDPNEWISQISAYSTMSFEEWRRPAGDAGVTWVDAHAPGASVSVTVTPVNPCTLVGGTQIACTTKNELADKDGNKIPASQAPRTWALEQLTSTYWYTLVDDGGTWKVSEVTEPNAS